MGDTGETEGPKKQDDVREDGKGQETAKGHTTPPQSDSPTPSEVCQSESSHTFFFPPRLEGVHVCDITYSHKNSSLIMSGIRKTATKNSRASKTGKNGVLQRTLLTMML